MAEKEREKVSEEVEQLRREMEIAQLNLIRRQLDDFDREIRKDGDIQFFLRKRLSGDLSSLFSSERELLHKLIQSGPSPTSFEAQVVLDQLLEQITRLVDLNKHS